MNSCWRVEAFLTTSSQSSGTTQASWLNSGAVMAAANPFVGQTLDGRFQLVDFIGSGAFSFVFDALDVTIGKHVAVKLLNPSRATDLVALAEFEMEGQLLDRLRSCENVINYVGTWSSPLHVTLAGATVLLVARYHVLELAEGCLTDLLPGRDTLAWDTKLQLFRDALKGTHQMHRHRTMHRDIKCDNGLLVLATRDGHVVKLGDLGRSRALEVPPRLTSTQYEHGRGDPSFAPPEYIWSLGSDDEDSLRRADLFLLGSLLYELGTGQGLTSVAFADEWLVSGAYKGGSRREEYLRRVPYLRARLSPAIDLFASAVPTPIRESAAALVTQLCDPEPAARERRFRVELRQPPLGLDWVFRRVDILLRMNRNAARPATARRRMFR